MVKFQILVQPVDPVRHTDLEGGEVVEVTSNDIDLAQQIAADSWRTRHNAKSQVVRVGLVAIGSRN